MDGRTFLIAIFGLFAAASFMVWTVARTSLRIRQLKAQPPAVPTRSTETLMTSPGNSDVAGAGTDWSSPVTWVIRFPLLIFEVTFAALLLADRLTPPRAPA